MSPIPDPVPPPRGLSPLHEGDPVAIGPHRLVGRIGTDSAGTVYGALDDRGACVAVRTVRADLARRPGFREALTREVAALARADGVGFARPRVSAPGAESPWVAFDHVPGRNLRDHVRVFGPLAGPVLRTFALGVAEGLAALHAVGIADRDLEPGNVVLSPDGPRIVDLGIAGGTGAERTGGAPSSSGSLGGSAPHDGAGVGPAADVFAWGALVTLAATRRGPFATAETAELEYGPRAGEYDLTGLPEELRGLVGAALAVDPARRPSSEQLVRALLPGSDVDRATVADGLRRMIGDHWRGVDAAGHDPASWAAALEARGGPAGVGAPTDTVPGVAAPGRGVVAAIASSRTGRAIAGVLAVAGIAAGGYVVYDQVIGRPADRINAAANALEEGSGFTARVTRSPTRAYAEQVSEETGQPVEAVVEEGRVEEEYLYSAQEGSLLIRGAVMGPGTVAVASHRDDLYVYASRTQDRGLEQESQRNLSVDVSGVSLSFGEEGQHGLWRPSAEPLELDPDTNADSVSVSLLVGPLRTLADAQDTEALRGEKGVYAGSTVLALLEEGLLVTEEVTGRVGLDAEGHPDWAEYGTDRWDVRVDFDQVGEAAELEDPQVWAAGNDGFGWDVVHAPVCGSVRLPDWVDEWDAEREWEVRASGWGVDCDYAMELAELNRDVNAQSDRSELLHGARGPRSGVWLYDDAVACGLYWNEFVMEGGHPAPSYGYGPCQEASVVSRDDSDPLRVVSEVDFGAVTLIDFHERG
ncbi:serine/threonine protein kinase [Nocardiopsis sp. NPDC007018]|uniref:serine/threonine protein kinase n=1 Tax=Nocardiopsis sp. NPDC007018 TaxID=3155721 RepID=UPI0033E7684E